jgi:hypothetical protein
MMVPEVQQRLMTVITEQQGGVESVYDPFVGGGSTLVAAMPLGLNGYGQDLNPLSILLSKVKTGALSCDLLDLYTVEVNRQAKADKFTSHDVSFQGINKWFSEAVQVELGKLRRAIQKQPLWARRFFWTVLAETIRLTSNDRTSTYKLHIRSRENIVARSVSPLKTFASLAVRACEDMRAFRAGLDTAGLIAKNAYKKKMRVGLGDTQRCALQLAGRGVGYDLLVTSPPYGDNQTTVTYGQHAYLPLQWIDLKDIDPDVDPSFLKTTHEIDRRSLGGHKGRLSLTETVERLGSQSGALLNTFELLASKPRDRTSRVATFYRDLDACLQNIMKVMRPNAYMCWTVANRSVGGLEIPTHTILRDLVERRGGRYVTDVTRQIHSKRMPNRNGTTSTMRSERILVFRRLSETEP